VTHILCSVRFRTNGQPWLSRNHHATWPTSGPRRHASNLESRSPSQILVCRVYVESWDDSQGEWLLSRFCICISI